MPWLVRSPVMYQGKIPYRIITIPVPKEERTRVYKLGTISVESKESFFHYVCQLSEIVIEVLDLFQQA